MFDIIEGLRGLLERGLDVAVKDERTKLIGFSSRARSSDVSELRGKPDGLMVATPYADEGALEAKKLGAEACTSV